MAVFLVVPVSFLAAAGLGCAFLVSLLRTARVMGPAPTWRPWFWLGGALGSAAVAEYSAALILYSAVMAFKPQCGFQGFGSGHPVSSSLLPMSTRCPGQVELVPGWVNPMLYILSGLCVLCLAAGTVRRVRHGRVRTGDAACLAGRVTGGP